MINMLAGCLKLKEIKGINQFNTINVLNKKTILNQSNRIIIYI